MIEELKSPYKSNEKPILEIKDVSMRFGGLLALNKISMAIQENDLVAIIGPNGAGKTTLFNLLTGIYDPSAGEVFFQDKSIKGMKPSQITERGIARTFQNIRLFKDLTVLDNITLAHHSRVGYTFIDALLRTKKFQKEEEEIHHHAMSLLQIFHLDKVSSHLAKNLPYGDQRKLEMCRALATKPSLLLLDEPAAGMNPSETNELTKLILWIRDHFKITIILIEHDMQLVMGLSEKIFVLDYGNLIAKGTPAEIQNNPKVIEAYLGTPEN